MNTDVTTALNWRYAVKEFDSSKKVSEEDLHTILESARLAPSSIGIEAWRFLVIENPEIRTQLRSAAFGQSKVTGASHIVVLTARTDVRENIANERVERTAANQHQEVSELSGLKATLDNAIAGKSDEALAAWVKSQTYIALGMMIETASLLNVDNCPMEGFDNAQVDAILKLSDQNLTSVSMLALGYRDPSDRTAALPKTRRCFEEVIHFVK